MLLRIFAAAALAVLLIAGPAAAHSIEVGQLSLTDLWTRATPPGAPTAAGYLTVTNRGSAEDRLIAVASPAAEKGELHLMEVKDGVMSMRAVDGGILIPGGGTVTLAPGGAHIMLIAMKGRLKEGERLPVTLTFERAGRIETFLHVLAIGARGPGDDKGHDMGTMNTGAGQ